MARKGDKKDKKLGEILVGKGLISPEQLELALDVQHNEQEKLGKILIGQEVVKKRELHQAIADKFGLKFVNMQEEEIDVWCVRKEDRENYFKLEVLPFRRRKNKIIIAASSINDDVKQWASEVYHDTEVEFVITSPFDILWSLQKVFEQDDDEIARLDLWQKTPNFSARGVFRNRYLVIFLFMTLALAASFYYSAQGTYAFLFHSFNILFFGAISFKIFMFGVGLGKDEQPPLIPDSSLPTYTILVPMYKEDKTLPTLINALKAIDYPKSKLDVKLIVEADDNDTIWELKKIQPPAYMEIIRVPYSIPRTKPKACNYALRYTRGEYVTVYDAEDVPEPMQLKKAVAKFMSSDSKLACVQARLSYFNYNEAQLARWFTIEYGVWFDVIMRGFARLKMAIPLGGTSNHVKARILREIGGWDAFNVTEDADLGMRLAQFGYKVDVIDSVTMEEAAFHISSWMNQRTRWLKGFVQTYFVHSRHPLNLIKKIGFLSFLGFQFFVGAPTLIYLSTIPLLVSGFLVDFPKEFYWIAAFNFVYGATAHIIFSLYISVKNFKGKLLLSALTFPLYALLPAFAAYRAVWQLMVKPYHWNKTEHGVTKVKL